MADEINDDGMHKSSVQLLQHCFTDGKMKGNRDTLQNLNRHTNPGKDKKHRLLQKGWLWRTSRRSKGVIEAYQRKKKCLVKRPVNDSIMWKATNTILGTQLQLKYNMPQTYVKVSKLQNVKAYWYTMTQSQSGFKFVRTHKIQVLM
ncbi:hypothetical protein RND71_032740 [Anisodus tanguticus]|uniref:Uncharacterized protein n=1 Tax=Anisodus tanguticus TaxID=243964 RepID=A0AAE1R7W9_9SOLA|nr:hypothetical protein RND71_032740 [Anisodus tanguticus]